jgi:putative transposase
MTRPPTSTSLHSTCIGWSLSRRIDAQLPLQALEMALAQPLTGLIHQPGRGRQYCSDVYVEHLLDIGACVSISTPGQPTETPSRKVFSKRSSVKRCMCTSIKPSRRRQPRLQTFLEDVYNAKRLLSSLDYVPPDEFELKYAMC